MDVRFYLDPVDAYASVPGGKLVGLSVDRTSLRVWPFRGDDTVDEPLYVINASPHLAKTDAWEVRL